MNKQQRWWVIGVFVAISVVQLILIALAIPRYNAQTPSNQLPNIIQNNNVYVKALVQSVNNKQEAGGALTQRLKVAIQEGEDRNQVVDITYGIAPISVATRQLQTGDQIILLRNPGQDGQRATYTVLEKYRLDTLVFIAILFALFLFAVGGWRGLGALISLAFSIVVLLFFTIPQLANGANILIITIVTALGIGTVSMFLSHGWNQRSRLAWGSMIITLLTAINLSVWAVEAAKLSGLAGEESQYLQFSSFASINFVGVIVASVIIASIGVLDDVTSSQAAVVDELHKANPKLTIFELFTRSMSVGREHIASMVNSLILVYLGTSFATFLVLFGGNLYPLAVTLNLEKISQEIVSSLVVSASLTLAVPITSFLTAVMIKRQKFESASSERWPKILTKPRS